MNRRTIWAALAAMLVLGACSSADADPLKDLSAAVEAAESGSTLHLGALTYRGPIVIDKAITIVGTSGTVILFDGEGPVLRIRDTDNVVISGLTIIGGDDGVLVEGSTGVALEDVRVSGARWHGMLVRDSEVHISQCHISGLKETLAQGIEITNSDRRPRSSIEGCTVIGPAFEGIVTHVSAVDVMNNFVTGTAERGINITEMSNGLVEGNEVVDAYGAAFFCGDMSECSFVNNTASNIEASLSGSDVVSARGHGLVVHYHSVATVDGLEVEGESGEAIKSMLESHVEILDPTP